jgi:hypothetical protein
LKLLLCLASGTASGTRAQFFCWKKPEDKYQRVVDQRGGAYSCLTGIAANISFQSGQEIKIAELLKKVGYPDNPEVPSWTAPIPMPAKL